MPTLMNSAACVVLNVLLYASCLPGQLYAQQTESNTKEITIMKTINSKILNEKRNFFVYLPASYSPKELFPVLYLLDGEDQTNLAAGQINYLSEACSVLPRMIIVGIANTSRTRDLTPTHSDMDYDGRIDTSITSFTKNSGGTEQFLQFIGEELMPYIQQHYKTAPFKIFSGHSLGGLTTIYCLLKHPDMFNAYISISPSLWWDHEFLLSLASEKLVPGSVIQKALFMSDGKEGGRFHKDVLSFDSLLMIRKIAELQYDYKYYPAESHSSEPVKALYDGIRFIYPDWLPEAMDTNYLSVTAGILRIHFQQLSAKFGYVILPPEAALNELAYYQLSDPLRINEAMDLFQMNVQNFPFSYKALEGLGDAYTKKGDREKAVAAYRKSLALNPKNVSAGKKLMVLERNIR